MPRKPKMIEPIPGTPKEIAAAIFRTARPPNMQSETKPPRKEQSAKPGEAGKEAG